jgi:5-methylcytosine-specific restriction enzyme subunit McrC
MAKIPIRNIYYLLSYAWDLLEEAETLAVDTEDLPSGVDLLARLLTSGTQRLLKRGMDRGYIAQSDVLTTLRGRVDFSISSRRLLLQQAKAHCDFEDFLPDLLHNQVLKAALLALSACMDLGSRQRSEIHSVLRRMEGISAIRLRKAHFGQVRLHRNNAHYRLLMHLCELAYDNLLVNEQTGETAFRDFIRDEPQMAKLFEAFVSNFYQRETEFEIRTQERIPWDTPVPNELLPEMHADAVIRGQGRVLVVECKFYGETLQAGYYSDKPKLRSAHLYQLSSYIRHLESVNQGPQVEGLLIYPTVGVKVFTDLVLSGQRVRACTIDLGDAWEVIQIQMHKALSLSA